MTTPPAPPPSAEALADRIDRLESRLAIAELVAAYAEACDAHDMPRLMDLFAEDIEIDSPSGLMRARGKAAVEALFVALLRVRGPSFHWTHDHRIRIDPADPDRATGRVMAHAETTPGGVHSLAALRYDDAYVRQGGVWRFARRTLAFLYYVPAARYPGALAEALRLHAGPARLPADLPETLASWKAFAAAHPPKEDPPCPTT